MAALYSAKKIGIWMKMGRQPASGLTFSCLYSSIIFCCSCCLSSLYFSCSAFILGCTARIAAMLANWRWATGNIRARTQKVRQMMATPKLPSVSNSQCSSAKIGCSNQ